MRQAVEEGFILDVLKNYTPYKSYYRIVKTAVEEKYFDKHNANKILHRYADNGPLAIKEKSAIMVEHFYNVVHRKIKGSSGNGRDERNKKRDRILFFNNR